MVLKLLKNIQMILNLGARYKYDHESKFVICDKALTFVFFFQHTGIDLVSRFGLNLVLPTLKSR